MGVEIYAMEVVTIFCSSKYKRKQKLEVETRYSENMEGLLFVKDMVLLTESEEKLQQKWLNYH